MFLLHAAIKSIPPKFLFMTLAEVIILPPHMKENMYYLTFYMWLILLNTMSPNSSYFVDFLLGGIYFVDFFLVDYFLCRQL